MEVKIMKLSKNLNRRFRRSLRAVSPVIAVLLMIVIAVAAALFAYAWVMGYLDFLTVRVDQGVQVQAIHWDGNETLTAYAQNTGPSDVEIANVYVDDALAIRGVHVWIYVPGSATEDWVLPSGETREIVLTGLYNGTENQVTVKLTTVDGNIFMLKKTVTYTSGGGPGPAPTPTPTPLPIELLLDDFNRVDSNTVGSGWIEIDSLANAEAKILGNRLVFDSIDDTNQPLVYHAFTPQTTGTISWTFTFNFDRTGSEGNYEFYMELGNGLTGNPTSDTANVAIRLRWGNIGSNTNHESFGINHATWTTGDRVAIVSGEANIVVTVYLTTHTFDLTISGGGAGGSRSTVAFYNNVPIDTVRMYTNGLNQGNFNLREIDNVLIETVP
jgi:flagellin-like protein